MNQVMMNFTPDLKPSRKSIVGTMSATVASPLPSSTKIRRRYSLAMDATLSVTVNGKMSEGRVRGSLSQPPLSTPNSNKTKSLHENLMMRILSTPVDQPLAEDDSDSSSELSFITSSDRGTPISTEEKLLIESDVLLRCTTPTNNLQELNSNPRLARLYKDLQSPSATTRLRALRALKSPSKREAYGQFDVPHEEQDIITAEEREMPRPKTIQEIMAGVCIYVEVRSGTDNRSDGIKDHLVSLGAKVNDKLYKDTTHVIFKDGLLSTYQKAKKMNIPVVSILWIEACKRHSCLMNPDSYPISNIERYENPELFKKIRRQKSMQPRAEEVTNSAGKKRLPPKAGASNDQLSSSAPKSVISPPTKLPVLHRLRKDDGLERILNEFQAENQNTPEPLDDFDKLLAGPMKLLEKFRNSPVTINNAENTDKVEEIPKSIRKSLFNGSVEKEMTPARRRRSTSVPKEDVSNSIGTRQRRKTILFTPSVTSVVEETETPVVPALTKPTRNRRKTMFAASTKENTPPKKRDTICSPKAMELCKANSALDVQENIPPPGSQKVRDTIYSPSGMEQSSEKTDKAIQIEMASSRRTLGLSTTSNVIDNSGPRKTKTPELDAKDLEAFRIHRRRTLYTPGVYDESEKQLMTPVETLAINKRRTLFNPAANSTATSNHTPANVSSSHRRRTLYTPSASVEVAETPENTTTGSTHHAVEFTTPMPMNTPKTTSIATATPNTTAQKRNKTLLEEYQSSLSFNSTKTPISERRKTIFDISMDIIDQRLSQINKQSKRSEVTTAEEPQTQPVSAEIALKSPPPRPSSISRQSSLDTFYRKLSKSSEKSFKLKSSVDLRQADITNATTMSRKRKLFNAQPSSEEPLLLTSREEQTNSNSNAVVQESVPENPPKKPKVTAPATVAKRRSLAAPAQKSALKTTTTSAASRRSSMFFSQPTKPIAATQNNKPVMGTQARTMKVLGLGAGLPTMASQSAKSVKPQFQLATTNLHAAQHTFVKEVVTKLGGFTVTNAVTDRTTHLVSLEPRRTINLLRALIRGLWIISYEWIEQSLASNRWLPEEQFELREFSPAVQLCRSERQAFGPRYRIDLFLDCGPFYVSQQCEVPHDQLRELIITCKGKVTGDATKAKFVIVSSRKDVPQEQLTVGSFCASPLWVLDSISENKLKKVYKYLIRN